MSKKLLICRAGTKEAILYDAEKTEIVSDNELIKLGATWSLRTDKYVIFHLKNAEKLVTPDYLSPLNFRYSTLEGLKRYIANPKDSEKYFYLTNPDAARLYEELMRKNIEFSIKWVDNNNDPSLIQFILKDDIVYSSDKFPDLTYRLNDSFYPLRLLIEIIDKE